MAGTGPVADSLWDTKSKVESGGGDIALLVAFLALFLLEAGIVAAFPFLPLVMVETKV